MVRKEVLKLEGFDGEEVETVEAEIYSLGWRFISQLKQKYMVVDEIVPEGDGIKAMRGKFNFEGIAMEAFDKGVKCDRKDEVDSLEVDRIYNKYYFKYFNPNNKSNDVEKKS